MAKCIKKGWINISDGSKTELREVHTWCYQGHHNIMVVYDFGYQIAGSSKCDCKKNPKY